MAPVPSWRGRRGGLVAIGLLLLGVAVGFGRSPRPVADVAACIETRFDPETIGQRLGAAPGEVPRGAFLGCRGLRGLWAADAEREALATTLTRRLLANAAFRTGRYLAAGTQTLPDFAGQTGVRGLVGLLDRLGRERLALERCPAPGRPAGDYDSLLAPFISAMLIRGQYPRHEGEAGATARTLADLQESLRRTSDFPPASCDEALEYGPQFEQFLAGAHPYARGCRPVPDGDSLVLDCSGR